MSKRKNKSLERAKQAQKDRAILGTGNVGNQQPGRHYFTVDAGCLDGSTVRWYFGHAHARGYHTTACDGECETAEECLAGRVEATPEYVVGQPECVICWMDEETHRYWVRDRQDYVRCEGAWDGKDGRPMGNRSWKALQKARVMPDRTYLQRSD